jgi:hypothetical protein
MVPSEMLGRVTLVRTTRRKISEDTILHSHRRENFKSYGIAIVSIALHILQTLCPLVLTFYDPLKAAVHEGSKLFIMTGFGGREETPYDFN